MAVMKEFRCLAHGEFEGTEAVCPQGCTTVVREFRTAPGTRSAKTKNSDRVLEGLAKRYGFSDMSNRNGSVGASRKNSPQGMEPFWGSIPKGNVFSPGKGEITVEGSEGGAPAALANLGVTGQSVAEALSKELGRPLEREPTFAEIQKTLPRVRPIVDRRHVYSTPQALDAMIEKT